MSKSKGEFLTVSLLESKGYDPLAYRFFCLQSHYRRNLVFSYENLDNAAGTFQKLIAKIAALQPSGGEAVDEAVDEAALAALQAKFRKALDNDLNTSLAITAIYDALKAKTGAATKLAAIGDFDRVLSLDLLAKADAVRKAQATQAKAVGEFLIDGEGDPTIDALVKRRIDAKKAKDFALADQLRDELKAQGIAVTDLPNGAKWRRI